MSESVRFFLNGQPVTIERPSPDMLLIDALRAPDIGLSGPKKPCAQGGCGGCTVIVSSWNAAQHHAEHCAINACLRPVAALNGLAVTTVEGTGSARRPNPRHLGRPVSFDRGAPPPNTPATAAQREAEAALIRKRETVAASVVDATGTRDALMTELRDLVAPRPSEHAHAGMNPVAWRLAANNGTQCGYCSVGFVMNMSEFLANNPGATKREIEEALDGNLCRCTGYRAILTGMKTFASDWSAEDEAERMPCVLDDEAASQRPHGRLVIPFPPEARAPAGPVSFASEGKLWLAPRSLGELVGLMRKHRGKGLRLVAANTAYGVYKDEYLAARVLVETRFVPELHEAPRVEAEGLRVPAGIPYTPLITLLSQVMRARGELSPGPDGFPVPSDSTRLGALRFMARRTAGRLVRNAATVGGNTMLVLHHIADGTGAPFGSDIATAMVAAGVRVRWVDVRRGSTPRESTLDELIRRCKADSALPGALILVDYLFPFGATDEVLLPQKVALREVNAHSIVNATSRVVLGEGRVVTEAVMVYGGLAPYPWRPRAFARVLRGRELTLARVPGLLAALRREIRDELAAGAARAAAEPTEGFTDAYRLQLALSFAYKAVVNALVAAGAKLPSSIVSSGQITWGRWAVTSGAQSYKSQAFKKPVTDPYIKVLAMEQTSGQIHYTHELAVPPRTVNASFVQSSRALASWRWVVPGGADPASPGELRAHLAATFPAFVDLVTAENIKDGGINLQGMGGDQPIFAASDVQYVGQSLGLVGATGEAEAARIAAYVTASCVAYGPPTVPAGSPAWWSHPVVGLEQAIAVNSVFPDCPASAPFASHVWRVTRPGSRFDWADYGREPLDRSISSRAGSVDGVPCQIVSNTQLAGGQIHFYMEPQAAIAEPLDGRRLLVRPSTQSPMGIHSSIATALGVQYHRVEVDVPPLGGGFGGKTEQAKFVASAAAVAAYAMKRPVRLTLSREQDTALIGKRHAYYGQYQVAIDTGALRPEDKGLLHGTLARLWGDGGAFYDCSFIVSNCIQTRTDNAYRVRNFETQIDVCRTNTAPSTAFRAFGDIQGKVIMEGAIDDAAFAVGMRPEAVREKNLYVSGDATPYGQVMNVCYIREVWDYLKQVADYETKLQEVQAFNAENRWRKRGLGMLPVKYGSGYNLALLEQATAILSIYSGDGSIVINQGGVEMGQGLVTQVRQIAAYVMNVPMDFIQVESVNTGVIPNPTSTGGSTGTSYNGEAVKRVCQQMHARLTAFAHEQRVENGDAWCAAQGIDYWNYPALGWQTPVTLNGRTSLMWQNLIALAYNKRVGLVIAFNAPIRGGEVPLPALTFKPADQQPTLPGYSTAANTVSGEFDSFVGFTYSAACAVVELDVLTGEVKVLSADLAYDMGWSLNPAIDVGQVEGAFVQGLGYLLTEKLVFQPDGEQVGALNTLNTWTYKPPSSACIPLRFNTHLFPRDLVGTPPAPTDGVLSSKEVGEPPLVLATSVFLAVKDAVRASRLERGLSGLFRLDAPATVQEVQRACEVRDRDLAP